jgi:CAP-Gly domain-containing linker protein 1
MTAALEGARTDIAALEQKHVTVMEERLQETQTREEAEIVKKQMVEQLADALLEKQEAVERYEKLILERDATARERDKAIKESAVHSEKMKELTTANCNLDDKLKSKEEECDILSEQIGELTQELQQSTQLTDERLKMINAFESEKDTLENRISLLSEALADAEMKASKSVPAPALDFNDIGKADEVLVTRAKELEVEMAEVQMENESLHNQVEFLNTVIVDLQRKNDWSQKRLTALEQGVILDDSDLQLMEDIGEDFTETGPPDRLFCDICDVFDEHDTADCPQQAMEEHVESSHGGQRGMERPYCDNCEMFGHWTENCDDNETF